MPLRFTYEGPEVERAVQSGAAQMVYFFMAGCPACVAGRATLDARVSALDAAGVLQQDILGYDVSRGSGPCAPADSVQTVPRLRLFVGDQHQDIDFRRAGESDSQFVQRVRSMVSMQGFLQAALPPF